MDDPYHQHITSTYTFEDVNPCIPYPKTLVFVNRINVANLVGYYLKSRGFNVGVATGLPRRQEWSASNGDKSSCRITIGLDLRRCLM